MRKRQKAVHEGTFLSGQNALRNWRYRKPREGEKKITEPHRRLIFQYLLSYAVNFLELPFASFIYRFSPPKRLRLPVFSLLFNNKAIYLHSQRYLIVAGLVRERIPKMLKGLLINAKLQNGERINALGEVALK